MKFISILYGLISIIFAFIAVLGFLSTFIHPEDYEWFGFFGLILLPVLAVNLCLTVIGLLLKSRWMVLSAGMLLLNYHYLTAMFQFTPNSEKPDGHTTIKIASYNVNNFYTNSICTLTPIASYMETEGVDVVCMQEVARIDSMKVRFASYPYSYLSEGGKKHLKQAIFSRYPLTNGQTISFPESTNLSVLVDVEIEGRKLRVFSNHLQTTSVNRYKAGIKESVYEGDFFNHTAFRLTWQMAENFHQRARQADTIRQLMDASPYPVIVCGDFNDTPASYIYCRIKGDLTDGFKECGTGYGATFRELKKLFRIDYIFYSKNLKGDRYEALDFSWSDHKVVVWKGVINQ